MPESTNTHNNACRTVTHGHNYDAVSVSISTYIGNNGTVYTVTNADTATIVNNSRQCKADIKSNVADIVTNSA